MALTVIEWLALGQIVALGLSGAINLWLYFSVRSDKRWKAFADSIAQGDAGLAAELQRSDRRLGDAHAAFDRRLSVLEAKVDGMPTHDDISEMRDQLSRIDERSESTQESVRRIEQHLLESKR